MKNIALALLTAVVFAGLGFASDMTGRGRGGNAAVNGGNITPATVTASAFVSVPTTTGCVALDGLASLPCSNSGARWTYDGTLAKLMSSGSTLFSCSRITGFCNNSFGYTSDVGSGSNGFGNTVNGARIDVGAGATDYFDSDGTTVTAHSPVATIGNLTANGNAFAQPGAAASLGRAVLRMTVDGTVNGNGADTTEDTLKTYALPAGAAANASIGTIRVHAWGDNNAISTTDVMTVRCYFGATVVASRVLTASQANTWDISFTVTTTGATTQITNALVLQQGATQFWAQTNGTAAETVAGAITIKCTGQRATTSTANSVRQLGWIIDAES